MKISVNKFFFISILFGWLTSNAQVKNNKSGKELLDGGFTFREQIYDFENKEIPSFDLIDLDGKNVKSEELKGKPTVINFWFSTCEPCLSEIPALNELVKKYGDDVNFIAITFEDSKIVSNFLEKVDFDFRHLINAKPYIKNFGMFGYPKTLVLDADMVVKKIEKLIPKDIPIEKGREELVNSLSVTINGLLL